MSKVVDWIDWLGGYPFEVARPADVVAFFERRGLHPVKVRAIERGHGNNKFVFCRPTPAGDA